jgi:hypothetical protein
MKKLGCASCGGTMKKMSKGGMATKAMGPGKQPFAAGIPYFTGAGQTGPESMKKGGTKKEHVLTTFRKANEARQAVVKKSITKYQSRGEVKSDSSTMKNAFSKDLMDAQYEEAKKKAFNNHKSELNRISQDNLIRQNRDAILKNYKTNSSTGKMERVSTKKSGGETKALPKAQLGTIVKTVAKYAKPVINAAKSAMGYAEPTVKKVADTYKKAKATSYAKKTAGLKRVEDWDAFNQGEYAKKVLRRTGAVVGGGAAVISGLSGKPKKKK